MASDVLAADLRLALERHLMCPPALAALQKLRFEFGDVYTVSVASFFGCEAPSSTGAKLWGDVSIAFTCDPANKVSTNHTNHHSLESMCTFWHWRLTRWTGRQGEQAYALGLYL
jgi:hypothetical protein